MNLQDKIPGSKHFTWKEALWLPQWSRAAEGAELTPEILETIERVASWMDTIREFFGKPINVHCWLRPDAYNALVGGAKSSVHRLGMAVDFDVVGLDCDTAKKMILDAGLLDSMQLRMEDIHGNWVHLDDKPLSPGGHRYFKP